MSRTAAESQRPDPRAAMRAAAFVTAGTIVLWFALSWAGGAVGIPPRYAFLLDFAALAAFFWAFVVAVRAWRGQRQGREQGDA